MLFSRSECLAWACVLGCVWYVPSVSEANSYYPDQSTITIKDGRGTDRVVLGRLPKGEWGVSVFTASGIEMFRARLEMDGATVGLVVPTGVGGATKSMVGCSTAERACTLRVSASSAKCIVDVGTEKDEIYGRVGVVEEHGSVKTKAAGVYNAPDKTGFAMYSRSAKGVQDSEVRCEFAPGKAAPTVMGFYSMDANKTKRLASIAASDVVGSAMVTEAGTEHGARTEVNDEGGALVLGTGETGIECNAVKSGAEANVVLASDERVIRSVVSPSRSGISVLDDKKNEITIR